MTMLPNAFDPQEVAPSTGGSGQLPISDNKGHLVSIIDSRMQGTTAGGEMLILTLEVASGEHAGATGDYRLNVAHPTSADTVRIAYSQLSAICHCVGWLQPLSDVSVLYGKPFRAVVRAQKGEEAREKGYTEVAYVLDQDGNKPGQQKAAPAPNREATPVQATLEIPAETEAQNTNTGFPDSSKPQEATAPVGENGKMPWEQ